MRLSPPAFRTFVLALTYSVSNRTDGYVDREDLGFCGGSEQHAPELVSAALWKPEGNGWCAVEYLATQTSRAEFEVLENLRRRERLKKQQQRLNRSGKQPDEPDEGTVPGDIPRDADGGPHRQEQEQEQGQDNGALKSLPNDWPDAPIRRCRVCRSPLPKGLPGTSHATCDPLEAIA